MDGKINSRSFDFPEFWHYPPYFTLQPIPETQRKQKELWRSLILSYCKQCRIFQISIDDQDFAPFSNPTINRHLSRDAKLVFLQDLVQCGNAEWKDPKTKRSCYILWKTIPEWGNTIYEWAIASGYKESVVTLNELQHGHDMAGTEIENIDTFILEKAMKTLELQGKAKLFKADGNGEDYGVKFF